MKKEDKQINIPVWEKLLLTVEEASVYSNIGINAIRDSLYTPGCPFAFYVTKSRALIVREEFEKYIKEVKRL